MEGLCGLHHGCPQTNKVGKRAEDSQKSVSLGIPKVAKS